MKYSLEDIIEKSIFFLIIFMPLWFGGVGLGAQMVLFLICGSLFFSLLSNFEKSKQQLFSNNLLSYLSVFFILFIFFQIVPLPKFLLQILSPSTYKFYFQFLPGYEQYQIWRPISIWPDATKIEFFRFSAYIFLIIIIVNTFNRKEQILRILLVISVTGFAIACFGIIQKFTWNGMIYWFQPVPEYAASFGPFVNRNHFAGYMELTIPIMAVFVFIEKQLEKRILFGFMSGVMLLALFLSMSRAGILSFFLALFLVSPLIFLRGLFKKQIFYVLTIIFLVTIFIFILTKDMLIQRFLGLPAAFSGRMDIYKGAFGIFKDFPLFGIGAGNFGSIFNLYGSTGRDVVVTHCESDWMQFLTELGLIGSFCIWSYIAVFLKDVIFCHYLGRHRCCFLKNVNSAHRTGIRHDRFVLLIIVAGIISITSIIIHGIFDINMHIPSNAMIACIIAAVLIVVAHGDFRA